MTSEREIDVPSVNLFQIDVFTDRTIEFDLLFICQFCFRSPIVESMVDFIEMFKLSPHTNLLNYVLTLCSVMQHLHV